MSVTASVPTLLAQALQQLLDMATGGADMPAILLPAAASATAPALLAGGPVLPNAHGRQQARADNVALYTRCLALYRERAQTGRDQDNQDNQDDQDKQDDLGYAAALFVMVNLTALGREGGDITALKALKQQLQNALQRLPDWPSTDLAAKQQMFEQLAILGVLVTQTAEAAAAQGPLARANVRAAAQAYLRQWLAVGPEFLSLSPKGLVVAQQAVARSARKVRAA